MPQASGGAYGAGMGKHIGCVGCGNMGGAILRGMQKAWGAKHRFHACNRGAERLRPLRELGIGIEEDAAGLARQCDVVILAVKPQQAEAVLTAMLPALGPGKILVSVAAGLSLGWLRAVVQERCPVVRCMPNTPALVGRGVFAFCCDAALPPAEREELLELFGALGHCLELPERQFAAFTALIGAGPAYVFAMMQGLVQAGTTLGFTQRDARQMVTALFEGSAIMAAQSPEHLLRLRDDVCSPGGVTIAGVNQLDRAGLTGLLVDAVLAAEARGRQMESQAHGQQQG